MPLCGFNPKMFQGLRQFADGLWDQIEKRSREEKKPIMEMLRAEVEEMNLFEEALSKRDPSRSTKEILGVSHIAREMYQRSLESQNHKEAFFSGVEELIARYAKMDEKYYGEYRDTLGIPAALEKLAKEYPFS